MNYLAGCNNIHVDPLCLNAAFTKPLAEIQTGRCTLYNSAGLHNNKVINNYLLSMIKPKVPIYDLGLRTIKCFKTKKCITFNLIKIRNIHGFFFLTFCSCYHNMVGGEDCVWGGFLKTLSHLAVADRGGIGGFRPPRRFFFFNFLLVSLKIPMDLPFRKS